MTPHDQREVKEMAAHCRLLYEITRKQFGPSMATTAFTIFLQKELGLCYKDAHSIAQAAAQECKS